MTTRPATENPLLAIALTVVAPALLLAQLSPATRLGPVWGLVAALSVPVAYSLWNLARTRHASPLALLGIASVLLTGGLALLRLDAFWIAVKEASIPLLLATVILATLATARPLAERLLLNPDIMDLPRLDLALERRGSRPQFLRLLRSATLGLAATMLLSATLNFALARWLLQAPPGSEEFNQQLARMTALSLPVITLPVLAASALTLWLLLRGIHTLTGLTLEDLLHPQR